MSADAGSYALENRKPPTKRITWREIEVEKWGRKRIACSLHPRFRGAIDIARCVDYKECDYESCPFVYWGCL